MKYQKRQRIINIAAFLLLIRLTTTLFGQYQYETISRWRPSYYKRAVICSIILSVIIIASRHKKRFLLLTILFCLHLAQIYAFIFILPESYPLSITTSIAWISFLSVATLLYKKNIFSSIILVWMIFLHLVMIIPWYEENISFQKRRDQNPNTREIQWDNTTKRESISLRNPETQLRQKRSLKEIPKQIPKRSEGSTISFNAPQENDTTLVLSLRDGTKIELPTQSSLRLKQFPKRGDIQTNRHRELLAGKTTWTSIRKRQKADFIIENQGITLSSKHNGHIRWIEPLIRWVQGTGNAFQKGETKIENASGRYDFEANSIEIENQELFNQKIDNSQQKKESQQEREERKTAEYSTARSNSTYGRQIMHSKLQISSWLSKKYLSQLKNFYFLNCLLSKEYCEKIEPHQQQLLNER